MKTTAKNELYAIYYFRPTTTIMRTLLLLIFWTISTPLLLAQERLTSYQFDYIAEKLSTESLDASYSYDHFMGEQIGKKLALLSASYTWKAEATATSPVAITNIEKPLIYNNVKKLERFYKKGIRKDEISFEEASATFERILDISLLIRFQSTSALEEDLKTVKEENELVAIFSEKIQFNQY